MKKQEVIYKKHRGPGPHCLEVPLNQRVWAWSLIKAILLSAEPGITAKESKIHTHGSEQGDWTEQELIKC